MTDHLYLVGIIEVMPRVACMY